jgi:hypothetical protein
MRLSGERARALHAALKDARDAIVAIVYHGLG